MSDTPKGFGHVDYYPFRFKDLMNDDLFYFERKRENNPGHRKLNESQAIRITDHIVVDVSSQQQVYQKDY